MTHSTLESKQSDCLPVESENVCQILLNSKNLQDSLRSDFVGCQKEILDWNELNAEQKENARKDCEKTLKARERFTQPLEWFLPWACEYVQVMRERASAWRTPLFDFVRLVRAHGDFDFKTAQEAFSMIDGHLIRRHRQGAPPRYLCHWREYLAVRRDDAEAEVVDLWEKVRQPIGVNPLQAAVERSAQHPLDLHGISSHDYANAYIRFVSLAGWLQAIVGPRAIALPQKEVSDLVGVEQKSVSRYVSWAVKDGLLKKVKDSVYLGRAKAGRAAEYLFDISRFPALVDLAEVGTAELFRGEKVRRKITAKDIAQAYKERIGSTNTRDHDIGTIHVLLTYKVEPEKLLTAIEKYGKHVDRMRFEPRYRTGMGKFFGRRGDWERWARTEFDADGHIIHESQA